MASELVTPTTDATVEEDRSSTVDRPRRRWLTALGAGLAVVAALTIPNDIVDIGFFTRGVPVRWWELPVALVAGALVAGWFLVPAPRSPRRTDKRPVVGATFVALFAVGCPTCNAVMMLALGLSGTLRYWAPLQPFLALLCLAFLLVALVVRWRRRDCTNGTCSSPS